MQPRYWREFWSGLEVGDGIEKGSLAIFPLFHSNRSELDYLVLEEAVRSDDGKKFRVEEVSEGGSVTNLRVVNGLDRAVLIVEGEILFGAKQTRTIHVTTLVGENSHVIVPVACVEAGRWRFGTMRHFGVSDSYAHAKLRSDKLLHIAMARRGMGRAAAAGGRPAYQVNQTEVWREVDDYMGDVVLGSPTDSADEVYRKLKKFRPIDYRFDCPRDCCGLAVDGNLIAVDCFDRPSTMQRMFPRLMEGYILEAQRSDFNERLRNAADQADGGRGSGSPRRRWWFGGRTRERTVAGPAVAKTVPDRKVAAEKMALEAFLDEIGAADATALPGLALGEDLRAEARDWSGAALAFDGTVLHGEVFPWGTGKR